MRPVIHCRLVNDPFGDPALYVELMFERRALLFDLGALDALPPRKLLRVSHAFVTHTHMDHFVGFDRLLRVLLGRDKTVGLFGPEGFVAQLGHKLHAYTWNVIRGYAANLIFDVVELHGDATRRAARFQSRHGFEEESLPPPAANDDTLLADASLRVRAAVLDHGTPCLGFAVEETAHVNVWKNRLNMAGFGVGPWLRDFKHALLAGAPPETPIVALRRTPAGLVPVTAALGTLAPLANLIPGQKIAYVADIRFTEANAAAIRHLAQGADQFYVECVFLAADAAHAARKNHLTAEQAGLLGHAAEVRQLIPFHFSPRYTGHGDLVAVEAERALRG